MPAPKSARQESKEQTRNALVHAAMELFSEQGLDGPSLDAICERAGFTRGAFYVHFTDRDELLVAVMEAAGRPIVDRLLADAGSEDLAATFGKFLSAFADGSYPLGPAGGIKPHQLFAACARVPKVRELYVGLISHALAQIERGVEGGQARALLRKDIDPRSAASLIMAAVIGTQTMEELGVPFDLGKVAQLLLQALSDPPR
jgi:TetR/AcrR family transcriptional repressor of nem operon